MTRSPTQKRPGRPRATAPGWRHFFWLWLGVGLVAATLVLVSLSAAAETERGNELIERVPTLAPNERRGAELYSEYCASCHGRNAEGNARTVTPVLAAQIPMYLIKQLVDMGEGERTEPEMHRAASLKALSTPQAIRDVATYLSALPRNPTPELGNGAQLALGKRYYQGLCAFCHGARGEGNEEHATPALRGQHYSYLLRQARLVSVGHRYSVDPTIAETLRVLPFDHLAAVADYASRLPADAPEPVSQPIANPRDVPARDEDER